MCSINSLSVEINTKNHLNVLSRTFLYISNISNWSKHGFIGNLNREYENECTFKV